jgi:hypothetical protein
MRPLTETERAVLGPEIEELKELAKRHAEQMARVSRIAQAILPVGAQLDLDRLAVALPEAIFTEGAED